MGLVSKEVITQEIQVENGRVWVIEEKNMKNLPRTHKTFKKPMKNEDQM